jgi:hypothetical protein
LAIREGPFNEREGYQKTRRNLRAMERRLEKGKKK